MVWAGNIITNILIPKLNKGSFIAPADIQWNTSCTSFSGVDSFVPIMVRALCTPFPVIDSLGPIVWGHSPQLDYLKCQLL
jgi:hypothetical protein